MAVQSQNTMLKLDAPSPRELTVEIANAARFVRRHAVAAIYHAGSGHPGAALSSADILAALFGAELNSWADAVNDPDRDRFVLSKGCATPALYAIAAHHGFCDSRATLNLRKAGSPFQGHPHVRGLPWVEATTGSPAQGLSTALGMAMGLRIQKSPARVYTLMGGDELQEGETWEAAMCAAHHGLDNLCVVVDSNRTQNDDRHERPLHIEPIGAKWRAFDWAVAEIDGHDIDEILGAFRRASVSHGRPAVVIAHTIRGKGVHYMENVPHWSGSVKLTRAQAEDALAALGTNRSEIKDLLDDGR